MAVAYTQNFDLFSRSLIGLHGKPQQRIGRRQYSGQLTPWYSGVNSPCYVGYTKSGEKAAVQSKAAVPTEGDKPVMSSCSAAAAIVLDK